MAFASVASGPWSVLLRALALSILVLLAAGAGQALAAEFTVNSTADTTECASTCTLRGALREAALVSPGSSDTILLPAGTFELGEFEEAHPTSTGQLRLTNSTNTTVTIKGAGMGATIIDAAKHDRVLRVSGGGSHVLEGITLEGGFPNDSEKDNTLEESVRGAGILLLAGDLTLDHVRVTADEDNGWGGGIDVESDADLKLIDSEVDHDLSSVGGGGGVSVEPGTLEATGTTFNADTSAAGEGGAMQLLAHSYGVFTNDTFFHDGFNGSSLTYEGGAAYIEESDAFFTNVTFAQDIAGGAFHGGSDVSANEKSQLSFTNVLFGPRLEEETGEQDCTNGSLPHDEKSIWADLGGNLSSDTSCELNAADMGRELKLGELGANGGPTETVPLLEGSPAIDFGVPGCPETDQREYSRVGKCDSGAFEFGGVAPTTGENGGGPGGSSGSQTGGSSTSSGGGSSTTGGAVSTPGVGNSVGIASTPKAIEEVLLGCGKSRLVLNDAYIHGGRVLLSGSAAKGLVGKKVEILFNERKQVASATVGANGLFTTTAPLPPAKIREALTTRYSAEIGKLRSLHLKLTRRLQLEPPKASGATVTLTGEVTPPLTKPVTPVLVEQQLECGKVTIAKTFTPLANGRFHITLTVPANAKAGIYTLKSKVAANAHATKHGFTTYSLPLPVALG